MRDLATRLRALGWHWAAEHLPTLLAEAQARKLDLPQWLDWLATQEQQERQQRSLARRTRSAQLLRFKPMADYDWNWPTKIDRELVESVLRLDFLKEPRNVVLMAAQGLGKTMIAQNLAHQAILAGHSVLFTTAARMLVDLGAVHGTPHLFEQRLRKYTRVGVLVCDEVGYLSYDAKAADLLFQVVAARHEKRPLVLTTNLSFSDWPTIFPNASCTVALIDRIIHHADLVAIEGKSYRHHEAEQRKTARTRRTRG